MFWLATAMQGMRLPNGRARWPDIRLVVHDPSDLRGPRSEQELDGSHERERWSPQGTWTTIIIGSIALIGHAADGERQHAPVFFESSWPGSTEDIVLAPAIGGGDEATEPVYT